MNKRFSTSYSWSYLYPYAQKLYGTGNLPSVKKSFVQLLGDAVDKGIMVVATTQCSTGSVMMGHYATGLALKEVGVVSANDMTVEATACKAAYLFGLVKNNSFCMVLPHR